MTPCIHLTRTLTICVRRIRFNDFVRIVPRNPDCSRPSRKVCYRTCHRCSILVLFWGKERLLQRAQATGFDPIAATESFQKGRAIAKSTHHNYRVCIRPVSDVSWGRMGCVGRSSAMGPCMHPHRPQHHA